MRGKIKWFNENKGFGFIEVDQGPDVFLHHSDISQGDVSYLKEGLDVAFDLEEAEYGPHAKNIHLLGKEPKKMDEIG